MTRPYQLIFALLAPIALINCAPAPAPIPAPASPAAPVLDPRLQVLPTAVPSPIPLSSPSPSPSASPDWRSGEAIAFEAPAASDASTRDLFVYSPRTGTVTPLAAANSAADECRPRLSGDRRWLVFQRSVTSAEGKAYSDVMLLDVGAGTLTSLGGRPPSLNKRSPAISRDGRWIAYVAQQDQTVQLKVYDLQTGNEYQLPQSERPFAVIDSPSFSADAGRVAFSAGVRMTNGGTEPRDLFVFDLPTQSIWTLPFANSRANEDHPVFASNGQLLVFDSDRRRTRDVFQANLTTGKLEDLAKLNSDTSDEGEPAFYGKDDALIHFKLFPAPGAETGPFSLRTYNRANTTAETLLDYR
jgi:Tol biopolymer transport system component